MGLDFSHCDAHWAYSGFHSFRTRLADYYGIDLNMMKGFSRGDPNCIEWKSVHCPLEPFLNHSDCDGELNEEEMKQIIPELEKIISTWDNSDYDKQKALLLIEGMKLALSNGEVLEFM